MHDVIRKLKNGFDVIKERPYKNCESFMTIVLAKKDDSWVTWKYNKNDDATYFGNYFGADEKAARKDFEEREGRF